MLSIEDVTSRSEPVFPALREGWLAAWELWREFRSSPDTQKYALPFDSSARATFLHNHAVIEIGKRLPTPYTVTEPLGFPTIALGDDALVRLKYLGRGGPNNVQTIQQKHLSRQQYTDEAMLQLQLEGFSEPPTLLSCGYFLNPKETEIIRIEIWRQCVGVDTATITIFPEPIVTIEPLLIPGVTAPAPARVRSKRLTATTQESVSGQSDE